jgi:Flp pilus assembly CpaF family ATPase
MTLIHSLSPAAIRARELLEDPETTEVHFNGPAHWSVKTGGTLRVLDGHGFSDERELVAWCNRLLEESGCAERLDGMTPVVEFAFVGPEVSARVHIVTEPVAPHTVVTVAKQTTRRITMAELVANDTLSAEKAHHHGRARGERHAVGGDGRADPARGAGTAERRRLGRDGCGQDDVHAGDARALRPERAHRGDRGDP